MQMRSRVSLINKNTKKGSRKSIGGVYWILVYLGLMPTQISCGAWWNIYDLKNASTRTAITTGCYQVSTECILYQQEGFLPAKC